MISLSPDIPLNDPADDLFNVATFAETLASGLHTMFQPKGFVVALHGPWGTGKTTLLNFVRRNLDEYNKSDEGEKKPIVIIDFNPWWFSGREDLTRQFFDAFGLGLSKRSKVGLEILGVVREIEKALSPRVTPVNAIVNIYLNLKDPKRKTIHELKEIVNLKLKELGRVLVIIDDIDRLTNVEIREIFQVIKAIGDFSNVIYLLAYDRKVIRSSLEGTQGGDPDDYLEKIVQASFDLPDPAEWNLRSLFFHEFSQLLPSEDLHFLNQERGKKVMELIFSLVETPRKMKHFLNAFRLSYPAVKQEVNPIDFAGIEAIRIFFPTLYHRIQKNEEKFFTVYPPFNPLQETERIEQIFSNVFSEFTPNLRKVSIDLICLLFPVVNSALKEDNSGLGLEAEKMQLKERNICTHEKFPVYFRWSLPEGGMSSEEFNSILVLTRDAVSFGEKLSALGREKKRTGEYRIFEFLNFFHAHLDQVPLENIQPVIQAFAREGDAFLPVIEGSGKYTWSEKSSDLVVRISFELLEMVDQSERIKFLSTVIENGTALLQISLIVQEIGRQHGWYGVKEIPEEKRLLTDEQFSELKKGITRKIERAAVDGSLLKNINFYHILNVWIAASPDSTELMQQWAKNCVTNNQDLILFITGFYLPRVSIDPSNPYIKYVFKFDLMKEFIEPDSLQIVAQKLIESNSFSEHQRDAMKDFYQGFM